MAEKLLTVAAAGRNRGAGRRVWLSVMWGLCVSLFLADVPAIRAEEPASAAQQERSLSEIQQGIAARYQRFGKTLTQLHTYMKDSDPARAELLMRVIGKSNEARVDAQLSVILELLGQENPQFGGIVERQDDLINSLISLLDVLQSEDERKRLQDEIARIEELIGDLNKLVVEQKEVRAGTERGRPLEGLEQRQRDVTGKTEKLAEKIEQQDRDRKQNQQSEGEQADGEKSDGEMSDGEQAEGSGEQKPGEQKPGESPNGKPGEESGEQKPGQEPSGEQKPGDPTEQKPGESPDADGAPSEPSPGEPSESSEGKPPESAPGQGQPQPPQPGQESPDSESESGPQQPGEQSQQPSANDPQEQTPGRDEIESAIEKMQRAIDELKEKNRDKASREQDQAIAELEKAKAKLEEILRQLREEEQKILLAALEARFRKMLQMQVNVRKSTGQIQEIPDDQRLPRHRARATQLARDEREIVIEADKALILLREEGTSVAFPEAVLQLREDMQTVAERLNEFQVDELTVAIEDDIIESLEELVEALRKEMEKLEQKEQQQQEGEQQEADQALVDLIAELKLLRSLQYRVNRRTQQFGRQIEGEQAEEQELLTLLNQLSERQARIQRATYDLSIGKNR